MELVTPVDFSEAVVELIEPHAALICLEAIADQEINEDYLFLRPDTVYLPADIISHSRSHIFRSRVRDHLLRGCVCIQMLVSLAVSRVVRMNADFVVVAFGVETEPANKGSYLVVLGLELKTMLNVGQVGVEVIADAGQHQIKHIGAHQNPYEPAH